MLSDVNYIVRKRKHKISMAGLNALKNNQIYIYILFSSGANQQKQNLQEIQQQKQSPIDEIKYHRVVHNKQRDFAKMFLLAVI